MLSFPQVSRAEGFTGAEFLTWEEDVRHGYIQTSVTMATLVVSEFDETASNCIDDWYLGAEGAQEARHHEITGRIEEFPDFHPSAVILVVLRNVCGPLE